MILQVTPARKTTGRKSKLLQYFLAMGDRRERVCQNFFLKTLDIGRKTVSYTLERKTHRGKDGRGRHATSSKIRVGRIKFVREQINSFPRMESHLTRKDTSKQYLATDLSIKQMQNLYRSLCEQKGYEPVSESKYRQIFCEDFNLSFCKSKKDQCSLCAQYNSCRETGYLLTQMLEKDYQAHQQWTVQGRVKTEKHKAKKDKKILRCNI